ncbi:MAG: M23 family peptidase, partial [Treponema sp.]|nr:M23 family peptidase [Treponema sp.]
MASVHEYKRLENKLVLKVKNAVVITAVFIVGVFKAIWHFLTRRYTLVFVPHSEKRVYNLHVTVLSVMCFLLVAFSVVGVFFWYGSSYSNSVYAMADRDGRLRDTQAS